MRLFLIGHPQDTLTPLSRALREFPHAQVHEFGAVPFGFAVLSEVHTGQRPLPDVVLIDMSNTPQEGIALCRWVKNNATLGEVPVLMIGEDRGETLQAAFAAGANDFIRQPVRPEELQARLRAAIRNSVEGIRPRTAWRVAPKDFSFSEAVIDSISNMGLGLLAIEKGHFSFVNPALSKLTGYTEAEMYAMPDFLQIFHPDQRGRIQENHQHRIAGEHFSAHYDTALLCKDGSRLAVEFSVAVWARPEANGVICLVRDIHEQQSLHQQLRSMADHDILTGLPNRRLIRDHLTHALQRCHQSGWELALLFLDLDGFKRVNDAMGHAAGDELLRQVAGRLQAELRPGDTAARLAGDEFVLILEPDAGQRFDPAAVAERLLASLRRPFDLGLGLAQISGSIGIVKSLSATESAEDILHRADMAMYRAKESGKDGYFYVDGSEAVSGG